MVLTSKSKLSGGLPQDSFQVDVVQGGYAFRRAYKAESLVPKYGLDNGCLGIIDSVASSRWDLCIKAIGSDLPYSWPLKYQRPYAYAP